MAVKLELIGNGNNWTTRILPTGGKATTPAGGLVLSVGFPEELVARESGDPLLSAALDVFLFAPAKWDVRARGFHVKEGSANPPSRRRVTYKELEDVAVKAAKRAVSEGKPVRGEVLDGLAGLLCKVSPWQATPNDPTMGIVTLDTWQSDPALLVKPWWLAGEEVVKPFDSVQYQVHLPMPGDPGDSREIGRNLKKMFKLWPDKRSFRSKTRESVHYEWLDPLRVALSWVNAVYVIVEQTEASDDPPLFISKIVVHLPPNSGVWSVVTDRRLDFSLDFYETVLFDSIQSYTGYWKESTFQYWYKSNLARRAMNLYQRPGTMPSNEVFRLSLRLFLKSRGKSRCVGSSLNMGLLPERVRYWLAQLRKAPAAPGAVTSKLDQVAHDYADYFWGLCRDSSVDINKIKMSRLKIWFPDDLLLSNVTKQIHGKLVPPGVLNIRGNDCVSPVDTFVAAAFKGHDFTDELGRCKFAGEDVDQYDLLRIINTDKELVRPNPGVVKILKPCIDALYQADGETLKKKLEKYARRTVRDFSKVEEILEKKKGGYDSTVQYRAWGELFQSERVALAFELGRKRIIAFGP